MTEHHKFDVDEVTKLLNIPGLVTTVAPGMTHILSEAMARLHLINSGLEKAKSEGREYGAQGGQPVAHPTPSTPVEASESTVADDPEPEAPQGLDDNGEPIKPNGEKPNDDKPALRRL